MKNCELIARLKRLDDLAEIFIGVLSWTTAGTQNWKPIQEIKILENDEVLLT